MKTFKIYTRFFNPHLRTHLLILERGREKHWSVASRMHPNRGWNLQPRYVSWLGINLTTLWFWPVYRTVIQPIKPHQPGQELPFYSRFLNSNNSHVLSVWHSTKYLICLLFTPARWTLLVSTPGLEVPESPAVNNKPSWTGVVHPSICQLTQDIYWPQDFASLFLHSCFRHKAGLLGSHLPIYGSRIALCDFPNFQARDCHSVDSGSLQLSPV